MSYAILGALIVTLWSKGLISGQDVVLISIAGYFANWLGDRLEAFVTKRIGH